MPELIEAEEFKSLVEEVDSIFRMRMTFVGDELMTLAFEVGEAITSSPLYKKFGKGNRKLIAEVAKHVGKSETRIYQFVEMKERWETKEKCVEVLSAEMNKPMVFLSDAIKKLSPPSEAKGITCRKCQLHCNIN